MFQHVGGNAHADALRGWHDCVRSEQSGVFVSQSQGAIQGQRYHLIRDTDVFLRNAMCIGVFGSIGFNWRKTVECQFRQQALCFVAAAVHTVFHAPVDITTDVVHSIDV